MYIFLYLPLKTQFRNKFPRTYPNPISLIGKKKKKIQFDFLRELGASHTLSTVEKQICFVRFYWEPNGISGKKLLILADSVLFLNNILEISENFEAL